MLYFYAKWFLIAVRASFAVILMQIRGEYRTFPFPGGRVSLQSRQEGGGCHSTIYSKHVECIKVLLHHYFRKYCFQISYLGIIYHSLSYFSKKSRSKWVFGQNFSQNQICPILLYRKPNFLIFMREHVIMTSQKPNAGHDGTYFGINV